MTNSISLSITPELKEEKFIELTENQMKVIQDKYLKTDPSVEVWLKKVAKNIALAELLYHPSMNQWGLFDGVRVYKKEFVQTIPSSNGSAKRSASEAQDGKVNGLSEPKTTRTWLLHTGILSATDREANFHRFLDNCYRIAETQSDARNLVQQWTDHFYNLLSSWKFLPNSPTLMNAGRELQQLSACYVLPVEDSLEGVTDALKAQALIHKSGGGTGFSFEKLRPTGDPVGSTSGVASGAVSFMKVFDKMTEVVKQGGNRRGANMAILPYWHPEIKDFIRLKNRPGVMENFNISVSVDDRFMEAAEKDWEYDLTNPKTNKPMGRMSAREIFGSIVENAWKSGDPGLVFIDKINNSTSHPTPALGPITATNPCGEQPLLPYEPCNLGSINLSLFVEGKGTEGRINWEDLKSTIYLSVRFLDDVIDVNNYPLPEIEVLARGNRRIGLGVMGWAEMLVKLGIPYDSEEALQLAKEVMGFINQQALKASAQLAEERGVFSNWKDSIYDPASQNFKGQAEYVRHCARTTIAPTGTIGLAAGIQGAGIEPFYAIAYTRYTAHALDAVKNGWAAEPKDIYYEVNPLFREIAKQNNFFGMEEKELWQKIEMNQKSVRGIPEIPQNVQDIFATAHDISIDAHVKMQAAFQEHTDNAVSKTINLPHNATLDDVSHAFKLAHQLGCRGITIYRDGSKQQQVLNLVPRGEKVKRARDFSVGVSSEYFEIKTGQGPLHVHIDYDEDGPFRISANIEPVGSEVSGLTNIIGVLISKYLENNGDPHQLLKSLQAIKGDRPFGLGENKVNSIPHGIAIALKSHLKKHGGEESKTENEFMSFTSEPFDGAEDALSLELWNLVHASDQCPQCFSNNISFNSGCSGPLCQDCGFSECS